MKNKFKLILISSLLIFSVSCKNKDKNKKTSAEVEVNKTSQEQKENIDENILKLLNTYQVSKRGKDDNFEITHKLEVEKDDKLIISTTYDGYNDIYKYDKKENKLNLYLSDQFGEVFSENYFYGKNIFLIGEKNLEVQRKSFCRSNR